ncbi:unnamed protein product [Rotaria sordida]|uniref:Uncharacterized protein n=2 Tax=Rotaria sordida TaxID=392033 RepID=A0A815BJ10_9BILA|nr:unnamed protein product [Rotaria sordida]
MGTNPSDMTKNIQIENSSVPVSNKEQNQAKHTNVVKSVDTNLSKESSEQILEQSIPSADNVLQELNNRSNVSGNKSPSLETSERERSTVKNSSLDYELQMSDNENTDEEHKTTTSINQTNKTFETEHPTSFSTNVLSNTKRELLHTFKIMKIATDIYDTLFIEDLEDSVSPLLRALAIRQKYMHHSFQSYPSTLENFLAKILEDDDQYQRTSSLNVNLLKKGWYLLIILFFFIL